jgi:hypothetical protein
LGILAIVGKHGEERLGLGLKEVRELHEKLASWRVRPVRQVYPYSATGGGEGRELCKILRDRKKIVDFLEDEASKRGLSRVQRRRLKSWSMKKENPL